MRRPYTKAELEAYQKELTTIAMLSNLFSSGSAPMIYYRSSENIYCHAFGAVLTARSDNTADALFDHQTGVGIKTFIHKKKGSYEKVAEFDKLLTTYGHLSGKALAKVVSTLRNTRIETTMRIYGLKEMIYHCVLRSDSGDISIFEIPMREIDLGSISSVKDNGRVLEFKDKYHEYKFYRSKSTLAMRFVCAHEILKFHIDIIADPMEVLARFIESLGTLSSSPAVPEDKNVLFIPLYAESKTKGCYVPPKSGLNSWNAAQTKRKRKQDEIYIRYSKSLQKAKPGFFPGRDQSWSMTLPDGKVLSMKVCQAEGKAIMSNPNTDIGEWLLREVLKMPYGKVVTYEDLLNAGITSIKITKIDDSHYTCDFVEISDE